MNAMPRGFGAAQRQYENASPPDEPEVPDYVQQDAVETVANRLHKAGEVDELVSVVSDSLALVEWLAGQTIPLHLLRDFRELDRKVRNTRQSVDEEVMREMGDDS